MGDSGPAIWPAQFDPIPTQPKFMNEFVTVWTTESELGKAVAFWSWKEVVTANGVWMESGKQREKETCKYSGDEVGESERHHCSNHVWPWLEALSCGPHHIQCKAQETGKFNTTPFLLSMWIVSRDCQLWEEANPNEVPWFWRVNVNCETWLSLQTKRKPVNLCRHHFLSKMMKLRAVWKRKHTLLSRSVQGFWYF